MVPKVFGDLLGRYSHVDNNYTTVYKLPPRKFDSAEMGVVEFKGHKLPPVLVNEQQELTEQLVQNSVKIPWKGTPV